MKKSSRQYQRNLTTNSYNQDFIYYKYQNQPSKSPKFKNFTKSQDQSSQNHSKIQSMKNTLNKMFDPLTQGMSKSFNKSVAQYPTYQKIDNAKNTKSVYEEVNKDVYLNNKLEMLTSKLRQIAQKPHFTVIDAFKRDKIPKKSSSITDQNYVKNISLINEAHFLVKEANRVEERYAKNTKNSTERHKDVKYGNYSQQLCKSKSKSSLSKYNFKNDLSSSNFQNNSLNRQQKQLKGDKSVSLFRYPGDQKTIQLQSSHRPRGKTITSIMNNQFDSETTKIKINSYLQDKEKRIIKSATPLKQSKLLSQKANVIKVLQPHRGPINSIIINSDGKRFLTASNDYTVKESTLDGNYTFMRKHQGRINVMRMIDDKLYTGGNDCTVMLEKANFIFQSPVLQIYPHEKEFINIGTSSSIQLFNVNKKIATSKIDIKCKFYQLCQKINKDIYLGDNHKLSIIDWRVPYPLINLYDTSNYVTKWVSDPYSNDFYHLCENKLVYTNFSRKSAILHQNQLDLTFDTNLIDYCWKKDKVYFMTQTQLQAFQYRKNLWQHKTNFIFPEDSEGFSRLQIKNDLWICGTPSGKLIVNKFS